MKTNFCDTCGKLFEDSDFVTLSKTDYLGFLKRPSKPLKQPFNNNRYRFLCKSPICRNVDLAEFIFECSESMILAEIHTKCIVKFGQEVTPSTSAIQRFLAAIPQSYYETDNPRSG